MPTVNLEIFARVYFRESSRIGDITLSFTVVNHALFAIFYVPNVSFNAIRENKILAKIQNLQYLTYCLVFPLAHPQKKNAFLRICSDQGQSELGTGNKKTFAFLAEFKLFSSQ